MDLRKQQWTAAVAVVISGSVLSACAGVAEADPSSGEQPAAVEAVEGTDLLRVTLTDQAAQRIQLTTSPIAERDSSTELFMPYGALLYDAVGATWAYVEVAPLTYMREQVAVDRIVGNRVVISDGPAAGTAVVTVGAAELYGAEVGVDK
ncbi:MAG: hypothetical protein M3Q17_10740 [Actinomycetota bacterium]|nr:hypothetical protein [Actinomycetota bacterium]